MAEASGERPPFTCPTCGRTSHNPTDAAEGYCGHCHAWTGAQCPSEEVSPSCDVGAHHWCNGASCACSCHQRPGNLSLWTVYDRPADYPTSAVARHWIVDAAGLAYTDGIIVAPSVDAVRALLPDDMVVIPRDEKDDPVIVETWI